MAVLLVLIKKTIFLYTRNKYLVYYIYMTTKLLQFVNEKQSMPVILRGAAIRILITRLYDQLYHPAGAFVIPKDPLEYFSILQFHQTHNFFEVNI